MRKEDFTSLLVYAAMIGIAVVLGLTVLRDLVMQLDSNHIPFNNQFAFAALVVVLAIIFNAILIEVGHLVGAKLGGYNVVLFNVLWFCFLKTKDGWKFRLKSFDGLTGETKMKPAKEKTNPKLYVWFPVLLYFIELIIVAVLFIVFNREVNGVDLMKEFGWIVVSGFIFAAVGGLINLYNYVPVKLDAMNDGYRLVLIQKPINKKAFDIVLTLDANELEGKEIALPEPFEEITNYTSLINQRIVYDYLDKGEYDKAKELIDLTLKDLSKVNDEVRRSLEGIRLFILCTSLSSEELNKYYIDLDLATKKDISSCKEIETTLSYLYIATLVEKSRYEIAFLEDRFKKNIKKLPQNKAELFKRLYEDSLQKLSKQSPELFKKEE